MGGRHVRYEGCAVPWQLLEPCRRCAASGRRCPALCPWHGRAWRSHPLVPRVSRDTIGGSSTPRSSARCCRSRWAVTSCTKPSCPSIGRRRPLPPTPRQCSSAHCTPSRSTRAYHLRRRTSHATRHHAAAGELVVLLGVLRSRILFLPRAQPRCCQNLAASRVYVSSGCGVVHRYVNTQNAYRFLLSASGRPHIRPHTPVDPDPAHADIPGGRSGAWGAAYPPYSYTAPGAARPSVA